MRTRVRERGRHSGHFDAFPGAPGAPLPCSASSGVVLLNASLFGWSHPAWAQQGGSKPEPWHFEFGG